MEITFTTLKGTTAIAEGIKGLWPRQGQPVHYRKRLGQTRCLRCWQKLGKVVWSTNQDHKGACK